MMDLSEYLLNSREELRQLMEVPGFYEFGIQVYNYFELMEPGTIVRLDDMYTGEKLSWVIKVAGLFVVTHHHWFEYELNDDCNKIRRKRISQRERAYMMRLIRKQPKSDFKHVA